MLIKNVDILSDYIIGTADAICFTSNNVVKNNGALVMGAGNAKAFRDKFKGIDKYFGPLVKQANYVYHAYPYTFDNLQHCGIFSFPTKYHYKSNSNLTLIIESARALMDYLNKTNTYYQTVYLPSPGCGLGGLDWDTQVRPAIENILDDRVIICFKE